MLSDTFPGASLDTFKNEKWLNFRIIRRKVSREDVVPLQAKPLQPPLSYSRAFSPNNSNVRTQ